MQGSGELHDVEIREGPPLLPGQEGQGHPARLREGPHRQEDRVAQVQNQCFFNPFLPMSCFYIKGSVSQGVQDRF